jgi:hypothetical protein
MLLKKEIELRLQPVEPRLHVLPDRPRLLQPPINLLFENGESFVETVNLLVEAFDVAADRGEFGEDALLEGARGQVLCEVVARN